MVQGIRGINLDVCNCGGNIAFCHDSCDFNGQRDPSVVFPAIKSFLDENPTDIILMTFQINSEADQAVNLNVVATFLDSAGLTDMLYVYDPETDPEWPTLRAMKESDKASL
jgi:hypothetical protein